VSEYIDKEVLVTVAPPLSDTEKDAVALLYVTPDNSTLFKNGAFDILGRVISPLKLILNPK